jgi:hypothetical protein
MTTEYTNIVQLGNKLVNELKFFIENKNLVGTKEANYIIESFEKFIEQLSNPIVSKELDNYKLSIQNPIEKFGLVEEVVKCIEEGKDNKEIAEGLALRGLPIESKHISAFKREYESADILTKIDKSNSSIFDTEVQLEMIFDSLQSQLQELEYVDEEMLIRARTTKYSLKTETIRELRMAIKDAKELSEAVLNLQNTKKFNQIVLETVNKECGPVVFNKVVTELRKQKLMFNFTL